MPSSKLINMEKLHDSYMDLMGYLERYKDSICYAASGVMPRAVLDDNEDPQIEAEALTAADIWPVETSGPKKGKIKATRDSHGNIVVDPAGNIVLENYLLDFTIYRAMALLKSKPKDKSEKGGMNLIRQAETFTKEEKARIKELFACDNHVSLGRRGPPASDMRI